VCTLLYRNQAENMCFEEIHPAEYVLLSQFQKGCTIADACQFLECQPADIVQEAEKHLSEWFQKWALRSLLTSEDQPI